MLVGFTMATDNGRSANFFDGYAKVRFSGYS